MFPEMFLPVLGVAGLTLLALTIVYAVIRIAVRDGVRDAHRSLDRER